MKAYRPTPIAALPGRRTLIPIALAGSLGLLLALSPGSAPAEDPDEPFAPNVQLRDLDDALRQEAQIQIQPQLDDADLDRIREMQMLRALQQRRNGNDGPIPAAQAAVQLGLNREIPDIPPPPPLTLNAASDSSEILQAAENFARQGRFDLAAQLWQKVLGETGESGAVAPAGPPLETLNSRYQQYLPVGGEVERAIVESAGEEGLAGYRLSADGEALALLKRSEISGGREAALAKVAQNYFLSSFGDDAAYELAARKLDRYEFQSASRLLRRVLAAHPDPSVDRGMARLRLAASLARAGDVARARREIALVESAPDHLGVPDRALDAVIADIARLESVGGAAGGGPSEQVATTHGGKAMPAPAALPPSEAKLGVGWEQTFDLKLPPGWPALKAASAAPAQTSSGEAAAVQDPFGFGNGPVLEEIGDQLENGAKELTLAEQWRQTGSLAGRMAAAGGAVFFKTFDRLACADAATGELRWLGFPNNYAAASDQGDEAFRRIVVNGRVKIERADTDQEAQRAMLFTDSIHHGMCATGPLLLTIEGEPAAYREGSEGELGGDDDGDVAVQAFGGGRIVIRGNFAFGGRGGEVSRVRENQLAAYDIATGKLVWKRKAPAPKPPGDSPEGAAPAEPCGFIGAPATYGSLVIAPVLCGRELCLAALDRETGEEAWVTALGTEPAFMGPGENAAAALAVESGEAYLIAGSGAAFSVDAVSGSLNWAVGYDRTPYPSASRRNAAFNVFGDRFGTSAPAASGWDDDAIIVHGGTAIFFPSDAEEAFAVDRSTGELAWEIVRDPFGPALRGGYPLGVVDGRLFVGGPRVARSYDAETGRLVWQAEIDPDDDPSLAGQNANPIGGRLDEAAPRASFAKGIATPGGIYLPLSRHIVRLDPASGQMLATYPCQTGADEPVGHLYSDGERLLALGLARVYALKAE